MVTLFVAGIIALCAVLVRFRPDLINVLSESERKEMNAKRTGRVAFWGLMTTALIMVALWVVGIRNELVPMFVGILGAIITAALIQISIPSKWLFLFYPQYWQITGLGVWLYKLFASYLDANNLFFYIISYLGSILYLISQKSILISDAYHSITHQPLPTLDCMQFNCVQYK